jgi:membrane protease YdiL (CAAX protease family)
MNQSGNAFGLAASFAVFAPAALLLLLATHLLIPFLSAQTGMETVFFWFLVAGLGVFLPLLLAARLILKREGCRFDRNTWRERLRFRALTRRDLAWTLGGFAVIGLASLLVLRGLEALVGNFDHSPPFMSFPPLTPGRYWLLAVWLPYWILNIMGEEILWRGVMLPRQEKRFGRLAWLVHGSGWMLFHIAFGWQLLLTMLPILFILPYVVQKTGNSWTGVILHAGINGPAFLAIAFGAM